MEKERTVKSKFKIKPEDALLVCLFILNHVYCIATKRECSVTTVARALENSRHFKICQWSAGGKVASSQKPNHRLMGAEKLLQRSFSLSSLPWARQIIWKTTQEFHRKAIKQLMWQGSSLKRSSPWCRAINGACWDFGAADGQRRSMPWLGQNAWPVSLLACFSLSKSSCHRFFSLPVLQALLAFWINQFFASHPAFWSRVCGLELQGEIIIKQLQKK